MMGSCNRKTRR